jgi:hypothetical protein
VAEASRLLAFNIDKKGREARCLRHGISPHPRPLAFQRVGGVWFENVKEQQPMGESGKVFLSC